jgi:hypothetical protein
METTKIKVKIGGSEFEAEGPIEIVRAQFDAFKEMMSLAGAKIEPSNQSNSQIDAPIAVHRASKDHVPLEHLLHVSGRVVSLTAIPASTMDAALLVMLGHKDMRNNLAVTGQEIGDGLAQSGRPVSRVDRVMEEAISENFVLKSGLKRGTRYRLTNQGLTKALSIAMEILETLPKP